MGLRGGGLRFGRSRIWRRGCDGTELSGYGLLFVRVFFSFFSGFCDEGMVWFTDEIGI